MSRYLLFGVVIFGVLLGLVAAAQARDYVYAYAPGDKNPTIEVAGPDDPDNPYRDQYTLLDRWAFANYAHYLNDENHWSIQMCLPNIDQPLEERGLAAKTDYLRLAVELDASGVRGFAVPLMAPDDADSAAQRRTLGQVLLKQVDDPAHGDTRPYFWALGLEDAAALAEYRELLAAQWAAAFPPVQEWMLKQAGPGDYYFFLPDGGVVVAVPDVKGNFSQRQAKLTRYDAEGKVLREASDDYMSWERPMLNDVRLGPGQNYFSKQEHFEASGRKTGTSNNIACTSRYQTYINEARDGFVAVIDYWQGRVLTPEDGDLAALPVDPYPYFEMAEYDEVARIYAAQQAAAGKQESSQ